MGGQRTRGEFKGLPEGGQKKGLQTTLQNEVVQEIEALIGRQAIQDLDFEALEMAARRQALRLAARALEQRLNADTSDHSSAERTCPCGSPARYCGRHRKTFESVLGPLHLERAYYHCAKCGSGFCPRDAFLQMGKFSLTPGVLRMTASVAALVSFEESHSLLHELAGVEVNAKQVERAAEALGSEIAYYERVCLDQTGEIAPTMYLGLDGTGVPMRASELSGRKGKQPDGSAKTQEAKVIAIWSAEARDAEGKPVRDKGSVSYSAALESAAMLDTDLKRSDLAERVLREAARRGFTQAARCATLGDGAPWIWNTSTELFPQAIQILDRFHAKEHLSSVGKIIYGADTPPAKQWIQRRYDQLDDGKIDPLLKALDRHAAKYEEARKCADYVRRNRHRMRYAEFHAQGLCTSTGVLEAGCKIVVGTRLKRGGMHWTEHGANTIMALRCCKLSARFEDFCEYRADRMKATA